MAVDKDIFLEDKKRSKKWYILFVLLIAGTLGYFFYFFGNKSDSNEKIVYVQKDVKKDDLTVVVSATGNLEPTNSVDIGIEVSGTIKEIYVDFNDEVKENQVMAKLDITKLESQVLSDKAALEIAKANTNETKITIDNKKSKYDRALKMLKSSGGKYPSKEDMEAYKYEYDLARASYDVNTAREKQALYNLKTSEENLQKATVRSSIDGIVLDRQVEVGQTVAASMQTPVLFTVAKDLKKMELIVSIDEADIADIKEAQDVVFSVDAYSDKEFKGRIKQLRLNPQEDSGVITYDAVISVDNDELLLKPGMTASANIVTKKIKDHLIVPNSAFRYTLKVSEKKSASLTFSRPKRVSQTKTLGKENQRTIWILKDAKPYKLTVSVVASDAKNSAVLSDELKIDDSVIISQKNSNE
jgi:HlyD family secretion protein